MEDNVKSLEVQKALQAARGNIEGIHRAATDALDALGNQSVSGLEPELLLALVEQFAEVKIMVALSSPKVVSKLQSEMTRLGRELTAVEKTSLLARVAPEALKVSLK